MKDKMCTVSKIFKKSVEDPVMVFRALMLGEDVNSVHNNDKTQAAKELERLETELKRQQLLSLRRYDAGFSGFASDLRLQGIEERIHNCKLVLGIENKPYTDAEKLEIIRKIPRSLADIIVNQAPVDFWQRIPENEKKPGFLVQKTKVFNGIDVNGKIIEIKRWYDSDGGNSFDFLRSEEDDFIRKINETYYLRGIGSLNVENSKNDCFYDKTRLDLYGDGKFGFHVEKMIGEDRVEVWFIGFDINGKLKIDRVFNKSVNSKNAYFFKPGKEFDLDPNEFLLKYQSK